MPKSKKTTGKNWVDPDDAPELTPEWFAEADLYDGKTLIRRGRPRKADKKVSVHLRIDSEVAAKFRATGRGWQTRMNKVLLNAIKQGVV